MEHTQAVAELRWFFRESSGDLGLGSNFMAVVSRIEGATPTARGGEAPIRRLDAAYRARRIARALEVLPPRPLRVLRLAYGGLSTDELRTVALATIDLIEAHKRSRTRRTPAEWFDRLTLAARKGDDLERRRTWAKIRASAQQALSRALDAYVQTRSKLDAESKA